MEALIPRKDESHGSTEPEELWERAIRMAVDLRRDPATRLGALRRVGEQLGVSPETLRNWVTQAEGNAGDRRGTSTDDIPYVAWFLAVA